MLSTITPTTITHTEEVVTTKETEIPGFTVTLTLGDVSRIYQVLRHETSHSHDRRYCDRSREFGINGTGETLGGALERLTQLFTTASAGADLSR